MLQATGGMAYVVCAEHMFKVPRQLTESVINLTPCSELLAPLFLMSPELLNSMPRSTLMTPFWGRHLGSARGPGGLSPEAVLEQLARGHLGTVLRVKK